MKCDAGFMKNDGNRPAPGEAPLWRRAIFALLWCPSLAMAEPGADGGRSPNVLFFLSDDHAAQAIGAYGSRVGRTPNIDRLADEGALFENCFCVNSICMPSRACVLTGLYSHANGVRTNSDPLPKGAVTFPRLLRDAGYATAIIGKWHLGTDPEGFDHWSVLPGQGAYFDPIFIEGGKRQRCAGYVSEIITSKAVAWLKARDRAKPFCLLVHHKAPHANWEPGPAQAALFEGETFAEPESLHDDLAGRSEAVRSHRLFVGRPQWELHFQKRFGDIPGWVTDDKVRGWVYQRYIRDYLRCTASVDAGVGQILDCLKREGLAERTLVIYSSDQGFFLGEHGLYDKRLMYEESIRMPLIVRWPGVTRPGMRIGAMALNVDLSPTLVDICAARAPADFHGRSLAPLLRGEAPRDWRTSFYYRFYEQAYGMGPIEGVRTMTHKLIRYGFADRGAELYDLRTDPKEMRNLISDPSVAAVSVEMSRELTRLRGQLGAPGL